MTKDGAETFALRVLGWLLENNDLSDVFLGATGCDSSEIRSLATDPDFLGAVLDFVMMDDVWVLGACEHLSMSPPDMHRARGLLPGGDTPFWT